MPSVKTYYIYIITNKLDTTLYIGVTGDLYRRIYAHRNKLIEGFSKKYRLTKLVYFEETSEIMTAIAREKQLKNWHREWKENLIRSQNPYFDDLAKEWYGDAETSSA